MEQRLALLRDEEPIAALASGTGAAAVALVRLSGSSCHALLSRVLTPVKPNPWIMGQLRLCTVIDASSGERLDEPLAVQFAAPRSFTGQEAAEIYCHGGPYIVQRVLSSLYAAGFRPAEPGEFTRRAFLNGKLDLTAAEGIRELVTATSHQQWLAARQLASGRLRDRIETLRTVIIESMAYLEAQIDFPDEGDTAHLQRSHVLMRVYEAQRQITKLLASYDSGRVASQGLMVALLGAPNAGKSTLLNELLGKERAIVTPLPGTTRDYLEESCLVHGRLVRLVDMAGLRDATDIVEQLGVETAKRLAREADIVLMLAACDDEQATPEIIAAWEAELNPRQSLRLATKADLGVPVWAQCDEWLAISCKTGAGVDTLKRRLAQMVEEHVDLLNADETFVTTARHAAALKDSLLAIERFVAAEQSKAGEEILAFELLQAGRALQALIGSVDHDDVLDKIFKEFCVGK